MSNRGSLPSPVSLDFGEERKSRVRIMLVQPRVYFPKYFTIRHELCFVADSAKTNSFLDPTLRLASRLKIDLLLYPELSLPADVLPYLQDWTLRNKTIVAAGSHYRLSSRGWIPTCPLLVGGKEYPIEKVTPAPIETSGAPQAGAEPGSNLAILTGTPVGSLGLLICSDYLDGRLRARYLEEGLDILCVVSLQHDSTQYHSRMHSDCTESSSGLYILYCNLNSPPYGDGHSAVFGLMHREFHEQLSNERWTNSDLSTRLVDTPSVGRYLVAELDLENKRPRVPRTVRDRPNLKILATDWSYIRQLNVFRRTRPTGFRYRMAVFDLDGTLIRGEKFGWTLVWRYLGALGLLDPELQKHYMRRYRQQRFLHNGERIRAYEEWCEDVVRLFAEAGLKRRDFRKIATMATVTKGLEDTLIRLRAAGLLIFIVSGGIDLLLYEMIPNVKKLVDGVDINIMKLKAPDDEVCGVQATRYDFEGKLVRIEELCHIHDIDLEEVVFVGDAFNDEAVMTRVGLGIAYSAHPDGDIESICPIVIREDNLELIVEPILGEARLPALQEELFPERSGLHDGG